MLLSVSLLVISIVALAMRGLNFGIDFTGGYVVEAGFEQAAKLDDLREHFASSNLGEAICLLYTSPSPRDRG